VEAGQASSIGHAIYCLDSPGRRPLEG
jgi:hypothetical protein